MLEELNSILDRINNWIIFTEARNSGLIAMNLGMLSFVNSLDNFNFKRLLILFCIASILVSAYSFLGINIKHIRQAILKNQNEELVVANVDSIFDYKDNSLIEKYGHINIYKYKDICELDEYTYLILVYTKLFKKNDNENYPIHINKAYQFKLAHRDIVKKIKDNSCVCLIKSKCFYISLGLFITTIVFLGFSLVI